MVAKTGAEEDLEELDRAHGRFDISLHRYMTWLEDALARRDKAAGFERIKLHGIVVLVEKATAVSAVSTFEAFVKAATALGKGRPGPMDLHTLEDLEAMLLAAWGLEVGRTVMKRAEYLDLLLAWRRDIIHEGDLPSEGFRRRLEAIYGSEVAAGWSPEAPQFPGPGGVVALMSNLAECEFLIYNELRAKVQGS